MLDRAIDGVKDLHSLDAVFQEGWVEVQVISCRQHRFQSISMRECKFLIVKAGLIQLQFAAVFGACRPVQQAAPM